MFSIYLTEAFRNLYTAKQRTLLALLGIIIGIGAMIGQVSISIIKGEETLREYFGLGTDFMSISKDYSEGESQNVQLSLPEVLELPRYVPSVIAIAPVMQNYGGGYRFAGETGETNLLGVDASLQAFYDLQMKEGRFFSSLDQQNDMPYVVIGCEVLEMPGFKDFQGKLVGAGITLNNSVLVIIGVLKCTTDTFGIYEMDWSILMPISTVQRQSRLTEIDRLIVRRAQNAEYLLVSAQIKQYFAKRVKGLKVRVSSMERWIQYEKNEARRMTFLSAAIGGLSLLAGSIGIMNVMLTAVIERRREIGILRAIGARQRDIRWQFLLEAVILSMVGGLLGISLGLAAAYLITWWNEWRFFISFQVILLGVGISWGVGIFFGFYPAYKAAKLDPIIALRTE